MITKEGYLSWDISFYDGVEDSILAMPPKIQARMLKLLEMIEEHGANIGPPHTESMGDGLFEIRAKAKEGIGRSFFCYMDGEKIEVLHAFVKKTQKTPKADLKLAKLRMKEVKK
jgi:phage-related protein